MSTFLTSRQRLALAAAAFLVAGLVAGTVGLAAIGFVGFPVAGPAPPTAGASGSQDAGIPACDGFNVTPCRWLFRQDSYENHRVVVTPLGNFTVNGTINGMGWHGSDQFDLVRWNVSVESFNGTVAVEVTHPDGSTDWGSTRGGWANFTYPDPAEGNWTVRYHPHQSVRQVRTHLVDVVHLIFYDFGSGNATE